jgi:hypothetical protein
VRAQAHPKSSESIPFRDKTHGHRFAVASRLGACCHVSGGLPLVSTKKVASQLAVSQALGNGRGVISTATQDSGLTISTEAKAVELTAVNGIHNIATLFFRLPHHPKDKNGLHFQISPSR